MHIVPILSVAITSFLIFLALQMKRCIYPGTKSMHHDALYYIVWIISFICLGIAGQKIWNVKNVLGTGGSVGRRVSFFLLLAMMILWPLFHWYWCLPGISMLIILLAIILSIGLIIVMIPKDKIASLLLLPITIGLIYTFILTWRTARIYG